MGEAADAAMIEGALARLDRMEREFKEMKPVMPASNASGNQNVTRIEVNAGGVGVWIACTCCAVMLAASLVGVVWVSREFTRLDVELSERKEEADRMQTYLSAIYARAPHLKPDQRKDKTDAQR